MRSTPPAGMAAGPAPARQGRPQRRRLWVVKNGPRPDVSSPPQQEKLPGYRPLSAGRTVIPQVSEKPLRTHLWGFCFVKEPYWIFSTELPDRGGRSRLRVAALRHVGFHASITAGAGTRVSDEGAQVLKNRKTATGTSSYACPVFRSDRKMGYRHPPGCQSPFSSIIRETRTTGVR